MDFKKFAGFLLAMLTFCSTAPVSEAADITNETELTQLMTVDGGSGTILNDISTANAIENSVNVVLASSAGNKFTLSGQGITIATGKSLTLYDIGITNALNFVGSSSLVIGNGAETQGVSLGSIAGTASILINSSMPVTFTEFVNAASFTLDSNSTSTVALNNGLTLSSNYSQNGGTVNVADGKVVNAKEVQLNGGELILGASSVLSATDTANGKVTVSGGKINSTSGNKSGVIKATTGYQQTGDGSVVNAETLSVENGSATLSGGTLTVTNLGTSSSKVSGNYTQTNGTLVADNAYIGGNAAISGGQATVNKYATVDGNVTVSGGSFTSAKVDSAADVTVSGSSTLANITDLNAAGKVKVDGATLTATNIGSADKKIGDYTQNGGVVNSKYIYSTGDITVADGTLNMTAGGNITTASTFAVSGETSNVKLNGTLSAQKFSQSQATVDVADGASIEVSANGTQLQNGAVLNLGSGSSLTTTGGNSSIAVSGGSSIVGGDGILSSAKDYTQSDSATNVNVRALNAKGNIYIGSDTKSGGTLSAKSIGSALEAPVGYYQYGSNVTTDNLYIGANGATIVSNASASNGALTVNNSLSSEGNVSVDGSTLTVGKLLSTSGDLSLASGKLVSSGDIKAVNYNQNGGSAEIASNKSITVSNLAIFNAGDLELGNNSSLIADSASGGIAVSGTSSINNVSSVKEGVISSKGYYNQSTSGVVNVNQIFAGTDTSVDNGVNISGTGTLNVNDIGTISNKVGYYKQGISGAPTVNAAQIQTSGDVVVSGGSLTVSDRIGVNDGTNGVKSYSQSGLGTTVSVGLNGLTSNGDISVAAGNLVSTGDITSSAGKYTQSGSSEVSISGSKKIKVKDTVSLTDSSVLNLGSGTQLIAGNDVSVIDSSVINDTANSATINVTGNYTQSGSASSVQSKYLYATGNVVVSAGNLTAGTIGDAADKRIANYTQGTDSTSATVTTDNIYSSNNIEVKNGTLTANNVLDTKKIIEISKGTVNVNKKATAGDSIKVSGGELNAASNATVTAANYVEIAGGEINLASGSTLSTTGSVANINVINDAKINADSAQKTGTMSTSNSYTQNDTSTVFVDKILAKKDVTIYNGTLNVNNIGAADNKIGGSYSQTESSSTTVNAGNIYAKNIDVAGGTLNLGNVSTTATLNADKINLTGGKSNLYNTTFKASTTAPATGSTVVFDGATVNLYGDNNLGLFDGTQNIYSVAIGASKATTLYIGDNSGNTDTLNVSAGAGNMAFGANATTNVDADGILNLAANSGNIDFATGSKLVNKGEINITSSDSKTVTLSGVNDASSATGTINVLGNSIISGNVYTDKYAQSSGKTYISADSRLDASNAGNAIEIAGGSLIFNGNNGTVNATNGSFVTKNSGTAVTVEQGTGNVISANEISMTDTALTVKDGTSLSLKGGSAGTQLNSVASKIGSNATLTVDTTNGNASLTGSSINAGASSIVNIQGNTNFISTTTDLGSGANLNISSVNGNVNFDAASKITSSNGNITVSGDSNTVTIAGGVNSDTNKTGNIVKNGKNSLSLDSKIYGGKLTVNEGAVSINDDASFSGAVTIEGSTVDNKTAYVTVADGKTLSSAGDITVGSIKNYANTRLDLGVNSTISGNNINLNAVINAIKSNIIADKANGGNVTIGEKTTLNVSHYDPDGENLTITRISGNLIKINGGSTINIGEGANLEYDGTVESQDAHYNVEKGAQWVATGGEYSNKEYSDAPGGGVLTNAGDVILNSNVTFKDSAATREGGAIYNTGTVRAYYDPILDAYAQNISFVGNSAGYKADGSQSAFVDQNGGAIYNGYDAATGSNGIIYLGDKTTFSKNKATGSGGAIYNISAGSATKDAVTIGASSTFTENSAMGAGGAIFAGENGKITIGKNATFSNNRAGFDANGLIRNYTDGGAIKVDTNATVSLGSRALFDGNIASNFGGAIANSGNLIFNGTDLKRGESNAVFTSNGKYTSTSGTYITRKGGAIYNTGTIKSYDEGSNTINGLYKVSFGSSTEGTGNTAEYGGALFNSVADDNVFEIRESLFQRNVAQKDGGAIYNDTGKMSITKTTFTQNSSVENGGAIYNNADLTIATGTVFGDENKGNVANNGGAIYNASKLTIAADEDNQIYFTGNEAKEKGGAIYNAGTINADTSNLLSYTNFYLNKAGDANSDTSGLGGAIYNASGNITIENSTFSENQAVHKTAKGGAIFNAAGAGLTIGNKTVINENKALSSVEGEYAAGGAIYNQGTLTIKEGSTLAFNKTDGMGGAIFNEAGAVTTLGNGVVIGGLMDEYYNEQEATAGNEALKGGGIYNEGTLNLGSEKIYIVGNKAKEAGGGIFNASADSFSTLDKKLVFYGNTALATDESKFGLGGGFYNDKSAGRVVVEDAAFINNAADIGSAIFNAGDMYIGQKANSEDSIKGNYIVGNKKGSAIGNSGTLELIKGWEFGYTESAYPRNAGALWNQDEGIITTSVYVPPQGMPFSINIHDAGYVDSDGNGVVDGAALHLQNKSAINTIDETSSLLENTIKYGVFTSNIGKRGGALYKSSTTDLYITDTKFSDNSAMAKTENDNNIAGGGAIYNEGTSGTDTSKITLEKSARFQGNTTTGKGGAIYNGNFGRIEFAPGYQMGESKQGYSNIAEIGGGAIANEGEMQLYIDPTSNRSMYFTYQGGAVSTKTSNIFNGKGGALYVANKGIVFTQLQNGDQHQGISNAVFTNNESMQGGALYKDSGTYLMRVQKTQFSGNRGYQDGGAVYNNVGELNIDLDAASNNIFVGNRAGNEIPSIVASGKGGAIYNAGVMSIGNSTPSGSDKLFVSNAAIGNEGSGGAIYNTGDLVVKGGVGFYNNQAKQGGAITVDGGSLVLDLEGEDVTFSQNVADLGSAIYIKTGSLIIKDDTAAQGHVTFVDADESKGIIAQTIASGGDCALKITGGFVDFLSDASGFGGSYYQTGGYVTVKNKFLNISDSSIRTVTGGGLYLSEGARLVSDQLLISNVETGSDGATIVFNKNSKAKLTDLSAIYDEDYATFGYFLYGNDEEGVHKISLRAANVYISDDAEIAKESYIGTAKNTYSVRNLYLSSGAKLNAKINVVSGNNSSDIGAILTLNEGALGSENAGVSLQGYNTKLVINNEKTPILLGGTIENTKGNTTNSITKSGDGLVTITGDASGYNGKYIQTAGTVEFKEGAKFFGKTTRPNVQGGTLSVANGVNFEDGTVIDISGNSGFATGIESDVDLTGTSGAILNMHNPSVQVNLSKDSTLQVTNNSNVKATKDVIKIGNAYLQVNSVILGGVDQQGGKGVNVTVNPNTKFVLQNDRGVVGQGGVLGFGENVTFKDTNGTDVTPVVQLKDNTQLKFINNNDSNVNIVVQSIDSTENINNAWAEANGDIVKENKGTLYLSGDVNDFHGSLIVKDGEIATNGTQFASDVVHDLSGIKDEASVRVKNITKNNDIVIVGDITSEKDTGKYKLDIQNDRGNVVLSNTSTGKNSDIYVKNESVANIVAAGSTSVGNTSITDKSVLNITNGDSYNVNGNLLIKDSTINMLSGNMNVAGNVSMGSTFNMMNGAINTQNIAGNMVLTDDSDYKIDINPMSNTSDKVVIGGTLSSDTAGTIRTLTVSDYNLITDPVSDYAIFNVFDVKGGIQDVQFATNKQNTSTPIANYMFAPTGNGSYMLARTGFTPSAMAAPVAVQVGGYLSQIATYDAAFGNLDTVMALPVVGYDGNRYANADMDETVVYSPLFIPELEKGIWFRPYGNFESVDLQDGPKVSNQSYGALVGGDTPLTELGNGFQGTLSGYIGYSGAHQTFEGISSNQNGGVIGATGAIYKGGFFSGLTINANAGFSNASTLYGKQDFFMLSAGIASKTGYNWELARGKFIIQPSWLMSYSFVNAFDDLSVGGTKLNSKALHGVQLAPGIKLMANLPQGWQPYLLFDFRFNIGDETHFNAGLIDLPDTYVKPYVEYGLGMQKRWGDRFTGFGQFLARGGGRNGVGLNFGLRWSVGQGR